jgi:3,4-dihydroxy 2-butanone 4-phosphate synthase/GTP cyclohydrolase II
MNDDGTMARLSDLVPFATRHGLKIGTIDDLIAYRLRTESIVRQVAQARVASVLAGDFDLHVFETTVEHVEHLALVKGDLTQPGPARACTLQRVRRPRHRRQDRHARREIDARHAREGRGVVVLIRDSACVPAPSGRSAERAIGPRAGARALTGRDRHRSRCCAARRARNAVDELLIPRYAGVEAFDLAIAGTRRID